MKKILALLLAVMFSMTTGVFAGGGEEGAGDDATKTEVKAEKKGKKAKKVKVKKAKKAKAAKKAAAEGK